MKTINETFTEPEFKRLLKAKELLQRQIAAIFKVTQVTVSEIKLKKKWSHLAEEELYESHD